MSFVTSVTVQHKFTKVPLKSAGNFYHWNVISSYQCLLVYHCNYVIFWISLNREFKCLFIYIMGHKKQETIFTLRAKHSGEVYCNRSCLWRAGGRRAGGRCLLPR